jgi:hypothetical protein
VSTSVASAIPYWGQSYSLSVQYAGQGGTTSTQVVTASSFEPEALRMTFRVTKAGVNAPFWFAEISLYNPTTSAIQNALLNATWVTLMAGFMSGPTQAGVIWDGPIFQVTVDRENVVDYRVTLHCFATPPGAQNLVNFDIGPSLTQQQFIASIMDQAGMAAPNLSQLAQQKTAAVSYPRGNTFFGKPSMFLDTVSQQHGLQSWLDEAKAYLTELANPATAAQTQSSTPDFTFSPPIFDGPQPAASVTTTIIGTPRQTPQGVDFEVLLDPRLTIKLPYQLVSLQNILFSQLAQTPGQTPVAPLSNNLFYVTQLVHEGDTRGNVWQTTVSAFTTAYSQSIAGLFTGSSPGGK